MNICKPGKSSENSSTNSPETQLMELQTKRFKFIFLMALALGAVAMLPLSASAQPIALVSSEKDNALTIVNLKDQKNRRHHCHL